MSPIQKAAESYINDLSALRGMLEPVMLVTEAISNKSHAEHLEALEEHGTEMDPTKEGSRSFRIPPEHLQRVRKLKAKNEQYRTAQKLLPRTFLVSFVSTYDAFLGNLTQALLESKPEVLNGSGKQLTYKELVSFPDMAGARSYVVEWEIETLLRKSHSEQFDSLEKLFDIKLREGLAAWPTFIELTERRNLFVHTHGKVSAQYIKNCSDHKAAIEGVKLASTLDASHEYLIEAYKCLFEIGIKLSQVLWRKLKPDEMAAADSTLISITFELLVLEKFDLARRLLEFATKLPRHATEANKRIFLINLAQSYKFTDQQEKCLAALSTIDWSACSDNFAVCVAVLKDHFDEATMIMKRIGLEGAIKQHEYIDWPVFRDFRKSTEFSRAYFSIFGVEPSDLLTHDEDTSATETPEGNTESKLLSSDTPD